MVTGKEYAAEALKIYSLTPKAGYIWGQSGSTWTETKQKNLVAKYNSDPSKYKDYKLGAQYGSKWIGHRVWDCSGLTSYCGAQLGLKYYHGSNSSYNKDCEYKGVKTKDMKLPVGAWVYTGTANSHGHIGIVVDDTYVVEAEGTIKGVVKSKISASKWTYWGLGKGMAFDFIPGKTTVVTKEPDKKTETTTQVKPATKYNKKDYPTIRRGAKGEIVKTLQTLLAKDGSSLAIDGIFGPGTQSAVRAFQTRHKLTVDGIVGPQTWGALLAL